jgi:hypothetical protein
MKKLKMRHFRYMPLALTLMMMVRDWQLWWWNNWTTLPVCVCVCVCELLCSCERWFTTEQLGQWPDAAKIRHWSIMHGALTFHLHDEGSSRHSPGKGQWMRNPHVNVGEVDNVSSNYRGSFQTQFHNVGMRASSITPSICASITVYHIHCYLFPPHINMKKWPLRSEILLTCHHLGK